jgi:hypothetical protein
MRLTGIPTSARWARASFSLTLLLCATALLLAPRAEAQGLVLIDSVANVSGSIASPVGNWSDAQQSLDLQPSIQVQQTITSLGANSFVSASPDLVNDRIQLQTGFQARTSGSASDVMIDHDYTLRFSLTAAARFELRNGNNTGSFPKAFAPDAGTTASLVYRLEQQGGAEVFVFAAPNEFSGSPGVYASGTVPAGDYVFTVVGSAEALGNACCVSQDALIAGNVILDFDAAPPVPGLEWAAAIALLTILLSTGMLAFRSYPAGAR